MLTSVECRGEGENQELGKEVVPMDSLGVCEAALFSMTRKRGCNGLLREETVEDKGTETDTISVTEETSGADTVVKEEDEESGTPSRPETVSMKEDTLEDEEVVSSSGADTVSMVEEIVVDEETESEKRSLTGEGEEEDSGADTISLTEETAENEESGANTISLTDETAEDEESGADTISLTEETAEDEETEASSAAEKISVEEETVVDEESIADKMSLTEDLEMVENKKSGADIPIKETVEEEESDTSST